MDDVAVNGWKVSKVLSSLVGTRYNRYRLHCWLGCPSTRTFCRVTP